MDEKMKVDGLKEEQLEKVTGGESNYARPCGPGNTKYDTGTICRVYDLGNSYCQKCSNMKV